MYRALFFGLVVAALTSALQAEYWQQEVAYRIRVTLDDKEHTLTGSEELTYINHSPDTLSFVWLHLYPNAYRDDNSVYAREMRAAGSTQFHFSGAKERGFMEIRSLTLNGQALERREKPDDGTELQVFLPTPLPPQGTITLSIEFFVKLPIIFSRLGHTDRHYEITQWYPKMVVYDRFGWHPDGYHRIGEFYGEFGTFDVEITVPEDLIVAATGTLVSPEQEIDAMQKWIAEGRRLDSLRTVKNRAAKKEIQRILKQAEKREKGGANKTLRFKAEKVHDFAWCADSRFIVKHGRFDQTDIFVYVLPKHEAAWKDAVTYVAKTLESYGSWYMPFPYPQQSVVDGDLSAGGGMEYPMLTIISEGGPSFMRTLEEVIMHEVGHNWFYGILGNNEMAEAWLDEGMNTFSEMRYMRERYGVKGNLFTWGDKHPFLPAFSDHDMQRMIWYMVAANRSSLPLSTKPYEMDDLQYAALVYAQGGFVLNMLQDRFGEEMFDRIMQTYFERWQFKHPTTEDFRKIVDEVTGEQTEEFFRRWVYGTARADLRIAHLEKERDKESNTVRVFVENRGDAFLPANVVLQTHDGKTLTQQWDGRSREPLIFQAASCKSVVIDPNDAIPEVNNWNNSFPRRFQVRPFFAVPPFDRHLVLFMPTLWYEDDVDGWRPGLTISGGNWRTFSPLIGFHEWHLGASYGTRSAKWSYSLGYGTHLYAGDRLLRFESELSDLEGRVHAEANLSTRFAALPWQAPRILLTAGWRYDRLYDLAYWETRTWSPGTVSALKLSAEAETGGFLLQNRTSLALLSGGNFTASDFSFHRLQITSTFDWRAAKELRLNLRLFAGLTTGTPALQHRLYLYGGMEEHGLFSPLIDGRGRFSPQERLQLPADGGNLRGYFGRYLSGDRLLAANAELSIPFMPIKFFFDAGSVWDSPSTAAGKDWRYDAGVSLPIGPLVLHLPIWVSDPLPDESEFEFRWIVSLSASSFRFAF